jgi:hypothetical protein
LSNFPNSIPSIPIREINYNSDILLTIKLGSILIGIESQGDPNSRMINDKKQDYSQEISAIYTI